MDKTSLKALIVMAGAIAFLFTTPDPALADDRAKIKVMTQNQYLGAALTPIVAAADPVTFNSAVIAALQSIAVNNFPERVQALAETIADKSPDLVGLQEVFSFGCIENPSGSIRGACFLFGAAFNDHLSATLNALAGQGANYYVAATVQNLTIPSGEFPFPGLPVFLDVDDDIPELFVTVIDRDVILARINVVTSPVPFVCAKPSVDGPRSFQPGRELLPKARLERLDIGEHPRIQDNRDVVRDLAGDLLDLTALLLGLLRRQVGRDVLQVVEWRAILLVLLRDPAEAVDVQVGDVAHDLIKRSPQRGMGAEYDLAGQDDVDGLIEMFPRFIEATCLVRLEACLVRVPHLAAHLDDFIGRRLAPRPIGCPLLDPGREDPAGRVSRGGNLPVIRRERAGATRQAYDAEGEHEDSLSRYF